MTEVVKFETECDVCDEEIKMAVINSDAKPHNCPLCGFPTSWTELEEED